MKNKPLTDIEGFIKDNLDGMIPKELASKYGLGLSQTYRMRVKYGVKRSTKLPLSQINEIIELKKQGYTYNSLLLRYDVSYDTLRRLIRKSRRAEKGG